MTPCEWTGEPKQTGPTVSRVRGGGAASDVTASFLGVYFLNNASRGPAFINGRLFLLNGCPGLFRDAESSPDVP